MFIFIICLIKTILFIIVFSGYVCVDYNGFAVDKEDNLYVGIPSLIKVYSPNGYALRSFSPKTSRGYNFTIKDGEVVLIDQGDKQYALDLYGNFLKDVTNDDLRIGYSSEFISESGNEYKVRNRLFRTSVWVVDGDFERLVFKMPVRDYIVKLLDIISDVVLSISICVLVFKARRRKNTGDGSMC